MFEKLNRMAEKSVTSASRRQFLGGLGRSALVVAATVAGVFTSERKAQMGRCPPHCYKVRGRYICPRG